MRSININMAAVLDSGSNARSAASTVNTVKTNVETIRKGLASDILNRDGNRKKLDEIISQLDSAAARINSIKTTVDNSANAYYNAEVKAQNNESSIKDTGKRLTNGKNTTAFKKN